MKLSYQNRVNIRYEIYDNVWRAMLNSACSDVRTTVDSGVWVPVWNGIWEGIWNHVVSELT